MTRQFHMSSITSNKYGLMKQVENILNSQERFRSGLLEGYSSTYVTADEGKHRCAIFVCSNSNPTAADKKKHLVAIFFLVVKQNQNPSRCANVYPTSAEDDEAPKFQDLCSKRQKRDV